MVQIFLCGPGGSGKTTLSDELSREKSFRKFSFIKEVARTVMKKHNIRKEHIEKYNDPEFRNFQNLILQQQCFEEEKLIGENIISDRCIIDCLAYSCWKSQEKELPLETLLQEEQAYIERVEQAFKRYQQSLVVVVHPWENSSSKEDGTRLSMTSEQCEYYVDTIHNLLRRHRIGYLDLRVSDLKERMKVLKDAMSGKVSRNSCTLAYYSQLSKKGKRGHGKQQRSTEQQFNNMCISFYLDEERSKKTSIRSLKICEDCMVFARDGMKEKTSRFFQRYGASQLFALQFDMKVRPCDVQKILLGKIFVSGDEYSFLGCSSSGLKSRKAFLWKGTRADAQKVLHECGRFEEILSKSKRIARVSLLFSSAFNTDVAAKIVSEGDITTPDKKYNFTDGCGGISIPLAKKIYAQIPEKERVNEPKSYVPSVYQFRLQGIKGVAALDTVLKKDELKVRPSMIKFKTDAFPNISVCGFSRPYSFGYLNRQLIYLLSGLGVKDENFLSLQDEYFKMIRDMYDDAESAVTFLQWNNKHREAELIVHASSKEASSLLHSPKIKSTLDTMVRSFISKDEKEKSGGVKKEKLRIHVKQSRMLYGVCDQSEQLKYGQCFVRITIDGVPKSITGKIVSGRMPCYLLGDVRVLEAVDIPQLEHLVDCVVFPTQGERPHADEQAGGDLDGDKFFICWDTRLIPQMTQRSHDYIAASLKQDGNVTIEKMIQYFSIQNEAMKITGLLANLYDYWADLKGPGCDECERIGQLFGRAIDATKSGEVIRIPKWLNQKSSGNQVASVDRKSFIWQVMEENAIEFKGHVTRKDISKMQAKGKFTIDEISEEYLTEIVSKNFCNLSEFQKFNFVWLFATSKYDWQDAATYINDKFADQINFSLFSAAEKDSAIETGIHVSKIFNALYKAQVLPLEDLKTFNMLDGASNWGLCYKSSHVEFDHSMLLRAMIRNDAVLITLKMPDDVYLAFQFNKQLRIGEELVLPAGTMVVYFISKKFGLKRRHQPDTDYYYDLVEDRFQIYQNRNIRQSFLWLKCSNIMSGNDIEVDLLNQNQMKDCLSVDLGTWNIRGRKDEPRSHPLINKTPFLEVEVFAMKDHRPAYMDVFVANEIDDIPEIEDIEDEEEDSVEERDVNNIILEQFSGTKISALTVQQLVSELDKMVATCVPWIDEPINDVNAKMTELVSSTDFSGAGLDDLVKIMVRLSRLQQHTLAEGVSHLLGKPNASAQELLTVLIDWSCCWYIKPMTLVVMFQKIKEELLNSDTPSRIKHVIENIWICFVELMNDITLCKEDVSKGAIIGLKIDRNPSDFDGFSGGGTSDENTNSDSSSDSKKKDDDKNQEWKVKENGNYGSRGDTGKKDAPLCITLHRSSSLTNLSYCPSKGEYIVLMRKRDWKVCRHIKAVTCIACVVDVTPVPLSIKVRILDDTVPEVVAKELKHTSNRWMMNALQNANVTVYTRVIKSSKRLLDEMPLEDNLFAAIYDGVEINETRSTDSPEVIDCNQSQADGIQAAINNTLTLIQGPPGTGKTKVACCILRAVARRDIEGVLAVAETNIAVDNLCKRLLDMNVKIIRVGSIKSIASELYAHTMEGRLKLLRDKEAKITHYRSDEGELLPKKNLVKNILETADVVLTTCAGAGDMVLSDRQFSFVLVDEATQTKEATLLCAFSHGIKQLVMIGDPNQLGPLVRLEKDWNWLSHKEQNDVCESLEDTLFHRLQNGVAPFYFLDTQYRMHPAIADYPSRMFYDSKLKSGVGESDRKPPWRFTREPMIFINIEGVEQRIGTSFFNEEEVKEIELLVKHLLENENVKEKDISILSLYKGQVMRLRRSLDSIEVNSIDGYQGREAEIIIVSTVRCSGHLGFSDDKKRLNVLLITGFSDDKKRLNVLLTRARRGLIVIGHRDTLCTSYIWKGWIDGVVRKTCNEVTASSFREERKHERENLREDDERRQPHEEKKDHRREGPYRGRGHFKRNFRKK